MSDQSTSPGAAQEAAGNSPYNNGPVTISWTISGDDNTRVHIDTKYNQQAVGSNDLHPGSTIADTGKVSVQQDWCQAKFRLQVPTPDQEGQLVLTYLGYTTNNGTDLTEETGVLLQTWSV